MGNDLDFSGSFFGMCLPSEGGFEYFVLGKN